MTNSIAAPLTAASAQWATRPSDERFTSLPAMLAFKRALRANSGAKVVPSNVLTAAPTDETAKAGLVVSGANGAAYAPTHWAFGQLAQLAGAPAGYLRTLPAPIAADAINYGLRFNRQAEEVGVLLQREISLVPTDSGVGGITRPGTTPQLVAATGPRYGRIWDADIVAALIDRFGDGVTGDFRVPGHFGVALDEVTKSNTTLYAGDRDMFVFLADEEHKVEIPNRRNGETGLLSRGFFIWNSEVGSKTFGVATFLFDYTCMNRMVWGPAEYKEIRIRHSSLAPERFLSEIQPALVSYANSATTSITDAIATARNAKIETDVAEFMATRFGKRFAASAMAAHELEEGRPIETLWDATVGATAAAKGIAWQDERVEVERKAGELLSIAA